MILVTGRREDTVYFGGQQRCQPVLILSRAGQALPRDNDMPSGQTLYFFFISAGAQASAEYDKQVQAGRIGRYELKIGPAGSVLLYLSGQRRQVYFRVTGPAKFQRYFNLMVASQDLFSRSKQAGRRSWRVSQPASFCGQGCLASRS